jgi:hypothetical protein
VPPFVTGERAFQREARREAARHRVQHGGAEIAVGDALRAMVIR